MGKGKLRDAIGKFFRNRCLDALNAPVRVGVGAKELRWALSLTGFCEYFHLDR